MAASNAFAPRLLCDCPDHQDERRYGRWVVRGEIDIPQCAFRCPYCTWETNEKNKRNQASSVRKHIKAAHISENGNGVHYPHLTVRLRKGVPSRSYQTIPLVHPDNGNHNKSNSDLEPAGSEDTSHADTVSNKPHENPKPKTGYKNEVSKKPHRSPEPKIDYEDEDPDPNDFESEDSYHSMEYKPEQSSSDDDETQNNDHDEDGSSQDNNEDKERELSSSTEQQLKSDLFLTLKAKRKRTS